MAKLSMWCCIRSAARCVLALGLGISNIAGATQCGSGTYPFPYTDVAGVGDPFCPGIMEAYVLGVTKGTTATTFSPNDPVSRLQMTTFLQRSIDQGLRRSSRRAALGQWWNTRSLGTMQAIPLGGPPLHCVSDGKAIWATVSGSVVKVEATNGKVLGTWTLPGSSDHVLVAAGKVFVTRSDVPQLYVIDPAQAPGPATLAAALPSVSKGLAYDGEFLWTLNQSGTISSMLPQGSTPWLVATGFATFIAPTGIVYDGNNLWITEQFGLLKLNAVGVPLESVSVGSPLATGPLFDGANIWVFNQASDSVAMVQASTASLTAIVAANASNQLFNPRGGAFDGERVLVVNGHSLTLFKAADFSQIQMISLGNDVANVPCSDGVNFWMGLNNSLLRF